jgi:sulfotransferase 6B1
MIRMLESGLHSRNGFVRKGCALALQAPKRLARARARQDDYERTPPVLANSFPKSGTHLLDQLVSALPGRRNYGSFLSTMTSSFQFRRRTDAATCGVIAQFVPGELVRGHLWYSDPAADALAAARAVHYLIIRDPRDVVVSEAHYLKSINRWHKLHPYFRATASIQDAISLSIDGLADAPPDIEFPNIGDRLAQYDGWFARPDVCLVRFEELTGPQRDDALVRIIRFYNERAREAVDVDLFLPQLRASIAPTKSHTFRSGKSGGWRESLTAEHRQRFKQAAGPALVRLGYEADLNW